MAPRPESHKPRQAKHYDGQCTSCPLLLRRLPHDLISQKSRIHLSVHIHKPAFTQAAEPGALPLRESPRAGLNAGNHFRCLKLAGEKIERFAVSYSLPRRAAERLAIGG